MTEATGGGGRSEVERRLIERSLADDAFRRRLLEDPKAAVERELGKHHETLVRTARRARSRRIDRRPRCAPWEMSDG